MAASVQSERVATNFFGEASERRPWALKREDRPKGIQIDLDQTSITNWGWTENNLRMEPANIVARYNWVRGLMEERELIDNAMSQLRSITFEIIRYAS